MKNKIGLILVAVMVLSMGCVSYAPPEEKPENYVLEHEGILKSISVGEAQATSYMCDLSFADGTQYHVEIWQNSVKSVVIGNDYRLLRFATISWLYYLQPKDEK